MTPHRPRRPACDVDGCSRPGIHRLSLVLRKSGSDTGAVWRRQVAWICSEHATTIDVGIVIREQGDV